MAESEEELKSLLLKVKEESEKVGFKLNIQKTKLMASGPITSWKIDGETVKTESDFILGGSKITADGDCSHEIQFSSVQFSLVTQPCSTLCNPMNSSMPGLPVHHQLPESLRLTSIESVMASSHLILCRPLLLLAPIPPSIKVFSNESTLCMRWPKDWSFSLSISPSNAHPGLIPFRMD